jgi:hypothetical protein
MNQVINLIIVHSFQTVANKANNMVQNVYTFSMKIVNWVEPRLTSNFMKNSTTESKRY